MQVKGTYVASESRTLREFVIKPIGLKTWTYDNQKFTPDYNSCIEGIDIVTTGFGLKFETPYTFEFTCDSIKISEPKEIETFFKPWISEDNIYVTVSNMEIPNPKYWIDFFFQKGLIWDLEYLRGI